MRMSYILNAQRLVQISQLSPKLRNTWYLIAAVTFSVCNAPQEIPLIYHYAMLLQNEQHDSLDMHHLAQKAINVCSLPKPSLKKEIDALYVGTHSFDQRMTERFREAILKTGPLAGLPKAINSLHRLLEMTPTELLPKIASLDPYDPCTSRKDTYKETVRRVNNEIENSQNIDSISERGLDHWNLVYNKVSSRVMNDLNACYPDLWYYTLTNVYGPLFSFDEILSKEDTSLIIIASLVPQDVNPQLKGHLRGALNVGCDKETIAATRALSITVAQMCGIEWKSEVVKL